MDIKIYFRNSNQKERLIGEVKEEKEIYKIIKKFCDDRNFKIYYTNEYFEPDGRKRIDVGSWSEFFYVEYKRDYNKRKE